MKNTVNPQKIQELKELDEDGEVLKELVGLFLPSTEKKLGLLTELKSQPSPTAIKPIAHEMRSSCANLGAEILSDLATQLEYLPLDDAYSKNVTEIIVRMNEEFLKVRTILITYK